MRRGFRLTLVVIALASVMPMASANDERPSSSLIDALAQCLAIAGEPERLACHDAATRALVGAVRRREIVVVDKDEVKKTRRSLFGFSLPRIGLFGSKGPDDGEEVTRLEGPIKRATRIGYGKWTLVLEDGAVWTTTEAWTGAREPQVGTIVTIKRGALGSYMATIAGGRAVRVMRTG